MPLPKFNLSHLYNLQSYIRKDGMQRSRTMQSQNTTVWPKSGFFYSQALFLLISLIPLIRATPAHANPTHTKSTPQKAARMIDTQSHDMNTPHTNESQAHTDSQTNTPKISSLIGKHLYNLGKCGLIAGWSYGVSSMLIDIINKKITLKKKPIYYYHLASTASMVLALSKSIHDGYKNIPTSRRVVTPLRTIGTIHCICYSGMIINIILGCKKKNCSTPHAQVIAMAAASIGVLGESLYRDYKAYKQKKGAKTITSQVPTHI